MNLSRHSWQKVPAEQVLSGDTISTSTTIGRVNSVEDWESKVLIQIQGARPLHVPGDQIVEVFR